MKNVAKQWVLLAAILICPILVVILLYCAMLIYNEKFLTVAYPKVLRVWVEAFAPPNDLYLPSAEADMRHTGSEWTVLLEPDHKYLGPYLVSVLSGDGRFNQHGSFSYRMKCWSEENTVQYSGTAQGPLWTNKYGSGESIRGAALNWYSLPEDFSLGDEVRCRVAVEESRKSDDLSPPFVRISRSSQK